MSAWQNGIFCLHIQYSFVKKQTQYILSSSFVHPFYLPMMFLAFQRTVAHTSLYGMMSNS